MDYVKRYLGMDFKSLIYTHSSFLYKSQIYYFLFSLFSHIIVFIGLHDKYAMDKGQAKDNNSIP